MIYGLIGLFLVLAIGGVVFIMTSAKGKKSSDKSGISAKEILDDFEAIRKAMIEYKNESGSFSEDVIALLPYMKKKLVGDGNMYRVSSDGKFLIVKEIPKSVRNDLIEEAGGDSFSEGAWVYLSFMRTKGSAKKKPVANFSFTPAKNITTNTSLHFDPSGSTSEGEIIEKDWDNKKNRYRMPGTHVIRLRVRDIHGTWSEWVEKSIVVTEKKGIKQLISCRSATVLLYNNGYVVGEGSNRSNELGVSAATDTHTFTTLTIENVTQAVHGEKHTLFCLYDGTVHAAGNNEFGQLGTGERISPPLTKKVWGLDNIKQVAASGNTSGALTIHGEVYLWGDNESDKISKKSEAYFEYPQIVENLTNVKQLSIGNNHIAALLFDGTVVAWGDNTYGQLGLGYKGRVDELQLAMFKGGSKVVCGDDYTLMIREDGRVYGCGQNNSGNICGQTQREVLFPTELTTLRDIVDIQIYDRMCVALSNIGKVYMWGSYTKGDGKTIQAPVELEGLIYIKSITVSDSKIMCLDENNRIIEVTYPDERFKLRDVPGEYREGFK